jgi:hypothetical protein
MSFLFARSGNCEVYSMELPFNTRCLEVWAKKVKKKNAQLGALLSLIFLRSS